MQKGSKTMESTDTEAMKYDGEKVRLDLLPVQPIADKGAESA